MHLRTVLIIVLFIFGVSITAQTEEVHTGYTDNPRGKRHVVALQTGQTLDAAAIATSGNLDVVLYLQNSLSQNVAESDDPNTADAALTYTAESDGQYIVLVASANGTYGDYALTLSVTEAAPQTAPHNNTAPDTPAHLGVRPEEADQIYTGYMAASSDPGIYPVWLDAGQAVIATASKSSGNLDTVLTIYDAEGNAIAENDNRDASTLNAEVVYVAEETGEYIIVLTSLGDTYGDFRVEVAFTMGGWMEEFVRTPIQGEEQIYDTPNFRIHYALDGADATTMEYVRDVALAMEEVRLVQISTIGWPMPPQDSGLGGDNRYDVYLTDVLDEMQGMFGYAAPELPAGDNPSTPKDRDQRRCQPSRAG